MLQKLEGVQAKYEELTEQLSEPDATSDPDRYRRLAKAHAGLTDVVEKYREYLDVAEGLKGTRALLEEQLDPEMRELAEGERDELAAKLAATEDELRVLLLPTDPNDEKSVIVEIRAGTGGDEAALFAANLYRMYIRYAEGRGWRSELMSQNEIEIGGLKEVIFSIDGRGAFSRLKFESGVHRVQRVPETESSGRIHTSTATVAVLPEAEDVELEVRAEDLRIDVYRAGGHGGQHVNTTDSAVRITHLPTGIVVACQDERSQLKNKDKAMKVLRARLYDRMLAEQHAEVAQARKLQVGSGDRSERIRTYNFPQGRVSDHRIGLTLYHLDAFMTGAIDEVLDRLIEADQAERLQQVEGE